MKKRTFIVLLIIILLFAFMQHYRDNHPNLDNSKGMVEKLTEWADKLGVYSK